MKCIECNRICGDCDLLDFLKGLKKSDCCLYGVDGLWTVEHMNVEKQLFAAIASGETLREVFDKAIAKDWKPVEGEDVFRGVEEDIITENLRLKKELESAQSQFKMLLGIRYQPGDPVVNYANSILLENEKLKEENANLQSDLDDLRISNGVTMAHLRLLSDYEKLEKEHNDLWDTFHEVENTLHNIVEKNDIRTEELQSLQRDIINIQRELIAEKDSHSLCRTELMDLRVSIRDKELANKPIVARFVVEELGKPAVERTEHHDYVMGMDYARDVIPPHTADDNSAGG
jgi:hypothetical protein